MHMDLYAVDKPGAFLVYPSPQHIDNNIASGGLTFNIDEPPSEIFIRIEGGHITDETEANETNDIVPLSVQTEEPAEATAPAVKEQKSCLSFRSKVIIGVAAVLSVITVIAVSVTLSLHPNKDRRFVAIEAIVQNVSLGGDLYNAHSPQARALHWLVYDDALNVSELDPQWIQQRYTMAVLYYSTGGGSNWTHSLNFLQPTHECTWNNMTMVDGLYHLFPYIPWGLSCNSLNNVTSILLSKCIVIPFLYFCVFKPYIYHYLLLLHLQDPIISWVLFPVSWA